MYPKVWQCFYLFKHTVLFVSAGARPHEKTYDKQKTFAYKKAIFVAEILRLFCLNVAAI